jgi:branched-chain amino acid aminotransferase
MSVTDRPNERVAYFNGDIVPESHALVPFRDRGFRWGDGVYDTERTVDGKIFKLKEHIDRLFRSLRYLHIRIKETPEEIAAITEEVVRRNLALLPKGEDYWVNQNISRGADWVGDEPNLRAGATVIIHVQPLLLRARASLFRDGIKLLVSPIRRTPPEAQSPRAKMTNYINPTLAELYVKAASPDAWPAMLDINGRLNEGTGQNLFLVRAGELLTPRGEMVLEGISRQTVFELAESCGIKAREADLDLYDAYTADEAFLSSTSLCICPVRSIDGRTFADEAIPGPTTRRLMDAYKRLLGFDFEQQYLQFLA